MTSQPPPCDRPRSGLARIGLVLFVALTLVSCAPRQAAERAAPSPAASIERIFVATELDLQDLGRMFGKTRPDGLKYLHVDVSIPPTHETGNIEWPEGPPDASTDFVITDTKVYRGASAMRGAMHRRAPSRETMVFVHGYNNTFSDALYRFAQIRADFDMEGPGLLYSWPSAGDPRGYAYDRDSVLYSRDGFRQVLGELTRAPGDKVFLLAHSMGAQLVMETLRQAALASDRRIFNRISGVVLMSPDIDPDVFRRQAEAIGTLPQPFLVFVSQQDRALSLAGLLTGRKPRLGRIEHPEQLKGVKGVQVIDFTALGDENGLNHSTAVTSPAAISVLKGMIQQAASAVQSFVDYMVLEPTL